MSRLFPFSGSTPCPICGTTKDGEAWLMPIDGTADGGNEHAILTHADCSGREMMGRMRYNKTVGIVYCFLDTENK